MVDSLKEGLGEIDKNKIFKNDEARI